MMEGCQDYYQVILNPIDLETMKMKANRGDYHSVQSIREDFDLMIQNCFTFNYVHIVVLNKDREMMI